MARKDKKDFVEKLAEEAEQAAERRDLRSLYKITKSLTGGFHNNDIPVKDVNGKTITSEKEQVERWAEHFRTILNRQDPDTIAEISEALEDIDVRVDPPTREEIRRAIEDLKNGKAPGEDGICVEMLKAGEPELSCVLAEIFKSIWEEESLPEDWQTGLLFKLPKKGDLGNCNNWRGIMLLSITSKIFSKIIFNRLCAGIDPQLRNEQAGFRKGKSCSDHIFTLRQILEQSKEWNTTLYATFIDLEKAFDSVHRESLWKILRHYGIPSKIVNIIRMLYVDFKAKVICGSQLSESFSIRTGVKQGCILSPFLFTLCIDWLMKETTKSERRGITWTLTSVLEDIDFADDICLLSQSHNDMQQKTNELSTKGASLGFKISTSKTKEMRMNSKSREPITVGEGTIEAVNDFIYLGSKMQADGDSEPDVKRRISKASQAFSMLKNVWRSKKLSHNTKIRIFKSNVLSVLLYGCESWKITTTISRSLEVFQNRCLRRILKIYWPNTISNVELHRKTSTSPIMSIIKRRRWTWIGHVIRMPPNAIPKIAIRWTPNAGRRKRGRPKETWRRSVEREMKDNGLTWAQVEHLARNRSGWRSLVSALCATGHEED